MRAASMMHAAGILAVLALLVLTGAARAQPASIDDAADRPISAVHIVGLNRVSEQFVRNNIRSAVGDPLNPDTVRLDVRLLTGLGEFESIQASYAIQPDGSVELTYTFLEQPIITDVQTVGNKLISDQDLRDAIRIRPGLPRDDFLIQDAIQRIQELYRERGHYLVSVTADEAELAETGILRFQVIEGPRVRIRDIAFSGNEAFTERELGAQIETETAFFILRKGELDEDRLDQDVASLVEFHRDRGYLDARVDRQIELSPNNREAKVTFLIAEGTQYRLRGVRAQREDGGSLTVYSPRQIGAMLDIKLGDIYSQDKLERSIRAIQDAYGVLGHIGEQFHPVHGWYIPVEAIEIRVPEEGVVDLLLEIDERGPARVGLVQPADNFLTKDKVILRQTELAPGRPFDATEIEETERRLRQTRLFSDARVTVLDPQAPAAEGEPVTRDVLIEVRERNTGAVNFGVGVGSDSGFFGDFSLRQENFDIADYPETLEELIKGRAFRGAGQVFQLSLRPGGDVSQYSISITEPYVLETNYSFQIGGFYRQREYSRFDEERINLSMRAGRRFGEIWDLGISTRFEHVELDEIDPFAPTEIFEDAGPNTITAVGVSLVRTTVGSFIRPGRGSRLELGIEQVGALGGDFTFTSLSADYTLFLTLHEDFFGRRSILKLNTRASYIIDGDDAPVYEQFYLGGRSFRGFEFRTVSPKGIRADNGEPSDDPVGGEWLFFLGAQYEFPIFEETVTGVFFVDSGTVTDEIGLDDYRVSVGAGLRLYIPQLGPVPIAFDFGFPIVKEEEDEEQILSFSAELPF